MRPTVVMAHTLAEETSIEEEVLGADADLVTIDSLDDPGDRAAAREAAALMVTVQPVPADLLGLMDRCRIVTRVGTGVDAIDIPVATARGIWVTNVPEYSIDEVSSHALALLMALQRNIRGHLAAAQGGDWRYQTVTPIRRFQGQTLGILGFGRIGGAMGRKGLGIGLRVIAHDPYLPPERIGAAGAEPVSFETLLKESDFLSLHVPLTHGTRGIIDAAALARMKPTAYLVNTARGEVVDISALVAAVRAGRLAGAGLDVLPTEPPDPKDPVLHEPRILVTPHVAWASEESKVDVRRRGAEDVLRVLRGERPRNPVNELNPERGHLPVAAGGE
jgi:D-3-phosphoglycerate dehydrogenase / 2-oxoglutarate reductase